MSLVPLRPGREIEGISAILLPFTDAGEIDWPGFEAHVARTAAVGLVPAVNMDTGFGNLLSPDQKRKALDRTKSLLGGGRFVAGAFVKDVPGAKFALDAYLHEMACIAERGGTPVIFQSYGLTAQSDDNMISSYAKLGQLGGSFIGFELGEVFAPFGKIYSLDVYRGWLENEHCLGAKHSSLHRQPEWDRIALRDATRPGFKVYTGNDLAIDMVCYGSDYLLGLSSFAPDLFAKRDELWLKQDPAFWELNDKLQYLGCLAFRPPVPAYKHSAAMFLKLRGQIACDATHPQSASRPASDREILQRIAESLELI
jgi:dihydrodipicolinate synthase/N-acetylneuraminate lyase